MPMPLVLGKHPCEFCGVGYLECFQFVKLNRMCCKDCKHPTRWSDPQPYTNDEYATILKTK
jgi:hypothetical protein